MSTSLSSTSEEHNVANCPKMFPVMKSHCLQLGLLTSAHLFCLIPSCLRDCQPISGVGGRMPGMAHMSFPCCFGLPSS